MGIGTTPAFRGCQEEKREARWQTVCVALLVASRCCLCQDLASAIPILFLRTLTTALGSVCRFYNLSHRKSQLASCLPAISVQTYTCGCEGTCGAFNETVSHGIRFGLSLVSAPVILQFGNGQQESSRLTRRSISVVAT